MAKPQRQANAGNELAAAAEQAGALTEAPPDKDFVVTEGDAVVEADVKVDAAKQTQVVQAQLPPAVMPQVAPDSWGPFKDYTFVSTPYGEHAVPARNVLTFEPVEVFNRKQGVWETHHKPVYTEVKLNLLDDPRILPSTGTQGEEARRLLAEAKGDS